MHCVPDVAAAQLILECQQADVHIAGALDLLRKLAPPDLLPLCVVRPPELKGHGDAAVHGFIQVMRPACRNDAPQADAPHVAGAVLPFVVNDCRGRNRAERGKGVMLQGGGEKGRKGTKDGDGGGGGRL